MAEPSLFDRFVTGVRDLFRDDVEVIETKSTRAQQLALAAERPPDNSGWDDPSPWGEETPNPSYDPDAAKALEILRDPDQLAAAEKAASRDRVALDRDRAESAGLEAKEAVGKAADAVADALDKALAGLKQLGAAVLLVAAAVAVVVLSKKV